MLTPFWFLRAQSAKTRLHQASQARIEDIADRHTPPFVILVYADLHSYDRLAMVHREAADRLDRRRFRPARLDEAMAAVTAWARGRVLVGKTGINERLAAAALAGVPTTSALP